MEHPPVSERRQLALAPGVTLLLAMVAMAAVGLMREHMPVLMLFYTVAFGAMLWAWRKHAEALEQPGVLMGWALAFRLVLVPTWPDLSDDLFRYVWDGWLLSEGINPYAMIPSDPRLAAFSSDPLFASLNSPDYHSVYPPPSQLFFLLGGALYPKVGVMWAVFAVKMGFLLAEVGALAFLVRARRVQGEPMAPLVAYAWNPLVVVVFAGQGHSEAAMMLGMALAIWALVAQRPVWSWMGYLWAGMIKLTPLVLGPLWLKHHRGKGMAPAVALGVVFALPMALSGAQIWQSLQLYVGYFEFNAGFYYGLKFVLYWVTGEDVSKSLGPALRWVFLACAVGIWAFVPVKTWQGLLRATALLLSAYLLTATTVHPWYLTWVLILVPFVATLRWAWLWVSYASFWTYSAYLGWDHGLQMWGVWGGFVIFALAQWIHDRRVRSVESEPAS